MTTAYASHSFQLTLDANSQLILSLHILQAIDYLADPSEYYSGNTVFSIEISDPVTGRQSVESRGVQLVGQSNPIFDVDSSVTYANTTDAAVNLEVTFWSSASNHVTTPVPEPSAYAMLVVGLAGMGAVARRQQCRA
ncbi:PEP-CTERM sorting domain-containing protein [Pseudoduganella umbonata]|nr:PEP-CTERM sorting domain-containing protein [Pseudoduganella umbonata]